MSNLTLYDIDPLRYGGGDCREPYQGFYELGSSDGFDRDLYTEHRELWFDPNLSREETDIAYKKTSYHKVIMKFLVRLVSELVFNHIKGGEDFKIFMFVTD